MLHTRIDPTVKSNRKPPRRGQERKPRVRSLHVIGKTECKIPKGAPLWTLSAEALYMNKWENRPIPVYDPSSGDEGDEDNDDDNDDDNGDDTNTKSKKRKRKNNEKKKSKKSKKNK